MDKCSYENKLLKPEWENKTKEEVIAEVKDIAQELIVNTVRKLIFPNSDLKDGQTENI